MREWAKQLLQGELWPALPGRMMLIPIESPKVCCPLCSTVGDTGGFCLFLRLSIAFIAALADFWRELEGTGSRHLPPGTHSLCQLFTDCRDESSRPGRVLRAGAAISESFCCLGESATLSLKRARPRVGTEERVGTIARFRSSRLRS